MLRKVSNQNPLYRGNKLSMGAEEDRKVAQRRKDELQRYILIT